MLGRTQHFSCGTPIRIQDHQATFKVAKATFKPAVSLQLRVTLYHMMH